MNAIAKIDEQIVISPEETIDIVDKIHKKMEMLCKRTTMSEKDLLELRKAKDLLKMRCDKLMNTANRYKKMMYEIDDKMKHTEKRIVLDKDNIVYLETEYEKYVNIIEQQNKGIHDYKTDIEYVKHELFVYDDKYEQLTSQIDQYESELQNIDKRSSECDTSLTHTAHSTQSLNVLKTMINEIKRELLTELNRLSENEEEIDTTLKNNNDKIVELRDDVVKLTERRNEIYEFLKDTQLKHTDVTNYINEMKSKHEFMKEKLEIKQQNMTKNIEIRDTYAKYIAQHKSLCGLNQ